MFFANILTTVSEATGNIQSKGCFFLFADEPECPKSLLK